MGDLAPPMFVEGVASEDELPDAWDTKAETVTLADVGGLADVKERLEVAFLAPMRNPELRKMYGKNMRGGLLLYGPPGCGKGFIARALAGELGESFIEVSINEVLDMYIGSSERNLHSVFVTARKKAPTVLLSWTRWRKRSHLSQNVMRTTVNQLLTSRRRRFERRPRLGDQRSVGRRLRPPAAGRFDRTGARLPLGQTSLRARRSSGRICSSGRSPASTFTSSPRSRMASPGPTSPMSRDGNGEGNDRRRQNGRSPYDRDARSRGCFARGSSLDRRLVRPRPKRRHVCEHGRNVRRPAHVHEEARIGSTAGADAIAERAGALVQPWPVAGCRRSGHAGARRRARPRGAPTFRPRADRGEPESRPGHRGAASYRRAGQPSRVPAGLDRRARARL